MDEKTLREFVERRDAGNRRILDEPNLTIRRFFALDGDAHSDGALSRREKELQGLVASTVLRCDECVRYHMQQASGSGATRAEIVEALAVALVVGGSIVIPHLRQAFPFLDCLAQSCVDTEGDMGTGGKKEGTA